MEIQNKIHQLGAVDLLQLSQQLNTLIAQFEDAKKSVFRVRMPNTNYAKGDVVIMPGSSNFNRLMVCDYVPEGKTTGKSGNYNLDYTQITEDTTSLADGEISWTIQPRVTVPDIPDAPVTSVNGKTGDVQVTCGNIGAFPATGGRLSGDLIFGDRQDGNVSAIRYSRNDVAFQVMGGVTVNKAARLILYGSDLADVANAGSFRLVTAYAGEETTGPTLSAYNTGEIIWNNKRIVQCVDGLNADILGNINSDVGKIIAFAGKWTKKGRWLPCNGAAVSRTTYKDLFDVIGTTYGVGDGSTTFNVPNLVGRFIQGTASTAEWGTKVEAGLPDITGSMTGVYYIDGTQTTDDPNYSGAFTPPSNWTSTSGNGLDFSSSFGVTGKVDFAASKSNSIYGKSTTVQPPTVRMVYYISY